MNKNKLLFFVVPVLAAFLTFAGALTLEAAVVNLVDIQGHWAEQEIAEMCASGVVTGYPGGFYQPDENVTKLEALVMLFRVLNLEEQAKNLDKAGVDYNVPPPSWGRGYMILGVQMGMLDQNLLEQMSGPATRVEVAALIYSALKLSPGSDAPVFEDADQIPPEYRKLVAAVVSNKIMQGFPGNIFKPNDEITRAQMAVLLSRIVEFKPAETYNGRRLSGTVSAIEPVSGVIATRQGDSRFLASDCEVFLDGKTATPDDLRVGDQVVLILDDNGWVTFIKAVRESGASTNITNITDKYTGAVDRLFSIAGEYWLAVVSFDGQTITRPVSSGTYVNDSGAQRDITWLSKGKYVEIGLTDNKIVAIDNLETSALEGTVRSVSSSALTLREDSGKQKELDVAVNVVVIKDDRTAAYDDVRVGNWAEVTVCDGKVVRIEIPGYGDVEGTIKELDTSGTYGITIRDSDGDVEDYVVKSDVEVRRDGSSIDFDELKTGERVRLELDGNDRVIYIEVTGTGDLEGVIRELDTRGTYGITIRDDDGDDEDYVVDSDVEVRRDGSSIDFDELETGERVRLELDGDGRVTYIKVLSSDDLEGKIRELDTSGTCGITIRNDDGDDEDYVVDSDVAVWRDDSRIDFDELDTGERVRLGLNSKGRVIYIEVVSGSSSTTTISGKVVELATGTSRLIRIQKSSGTKSQYNISSSVVYYRDGERIDLEDIVIGSEVEVSLEDGKIKKIEVTNDQDITLEGTVTYVNTGSKKIRIEQVSGNSFTYYLAGNAKLRDRDGDSIDLGDIDEDWEVELELRDGEIYRLTRQ